MWDLLSYLIWMVVLITMVLAVGFGIKWYFGGGFALTTYFGGSRDLRLDVSEQANVDGKRKLLLIRRDDVEHLIMTGGPVDVVIETGIAAAAGHHGKVRQTPTLGERSQPSGAGTVTEPVFSRPARSFGKAVGEN